MSIGVPTLGLGINAMRFRGGGGAAPSNPVILAYQAMGSLDSGGAVSSHIFTIPLTVAANPDGSRFVMVGGISGSNNIAYSSVTIDGQAATQVGTISSGAPDSGDNRASLAIFKSIGTAGTSINVTFTLSCIAGPVFAGYAACYNCGTLNPLTHATVTAGIDDPTLDIATATGGAVLGGTLVYTASGAPDITWTGLSEDAQGAQLYGGDNISVAHANNTTAQALRPISAVMTPDAQSGASIAVSLKP